MSSSGTLLTDLPSTNSSDGDLVTKIMADMNLTKNQNNQMPMPAPPSSNQQHIITNSPNPNSTFQTSIDPSIPNTHLIGKNYPSTNDFAELMRNAPSYTSQQQDPSQGSPPARNIQSIINQFKQPIVVMIIIFIINTTVFNVIISHYIPQLIASTGEFTTLGLLFKSVTGGLLFWFVQSVLAPLLSVSV